MPTSIINTVRTSSTLQHNDRLGFDQQGEVQSSGRQHLGNIFARAWDCLTRSREQVETNQSVARQFIAEIKEQYGDKVAQMAARELKGHLELGRPLTTYRVKVVLSHANELRNRINAHNEKLFTRNVEAIVERALKSAFGEDKLPAFLDKEALKAMDRAITSDPNFSRTDFRKNEQQFIRYFSGIGQRALEQAALEELMPSTMRLSRDEVGVNLTSSPHEQLQGALLDELHLTEEQQMAFNMQLVSMGNLTDALIGLGSEGTIPPEKIQIYLGYLGLVRDQLDGQGIAQTWGELQDLSDKAIALRQAMLDDLKGLETRLLGLLGLDELDEQTRIFVLEANQTLGEIEQNSTERGWQSLIQNLDGQIEQLETIEQQLMALEPGKESSVALLDTMRRRCGSTLEGLRQFRDDISLGAQKGVPPRVVAELRNAGCPVTEATLDRLNDEIGFKLEDLQWMKAHGHELETTLLRFRPQEVEYLRGAGLGIEIGLQYLDRDIPIHPRTLTGQHTDSHVEGEPVLLRGGAVSRPYAVNYRLDNDELDERVFKVASPKEGFGPASQELGINPDHPQMTVRNIATKIVDEMLEFNLVPDTRIGILNGQLGMVMNFVHGAPGSSTQDEDVTETDMGQMLLGMRREVEAGERTQAEMDEYLNGLKMRFTEDSHVIHAKTVGVGHDFDDPTLRRELVKLQLLDALTAQTDRHSGNYVILHTDNGIKLQAIDNDQAFGPRFGNPNDLQGCINFRSVKLPPVVDPEIRSAFDRLDGEQLRNQLQGLLPDAEIEKAVERLNVIKNYLNQDGPPPVVLESSSQEVWGTELVGELLSAPDTSYVGRDKSGMQMLPVILSYEEAKR